jgi:hypothetical protein
MIFWCVVTGLLYLRMTLYRKGALKFNCKVHQPVRPGALLQLQFAIAKIYLIA